MKELSGCKWYWFIPAIGFIFLGKISHWVYESKEYEHKREMVILTIWQFIQMMGVVESFHYFKSII